MSGPFTAFCACAHRDGALECVCLTAVGRSFSTCRACRMGQHDTIDHGSAPALIAVERAVVDGAK